MDSIIITTISSALTGIATWFVSKSRRDNNFVAELQSTINMLVAKNKEQLAMIIEMGDKLAAQHVELAEIKKENASLRYEVQGLSEKLSNAKITIKK
jgi:hypothetical protein